FGGAFFDFVGDAQHDLGAFGGGGLGPRAGGEGGVGCLDGGVHIGAGSDGDGAPDGVGGRIDDFNDLVTLAFSPGAVDEVGGDVSVGNLDGVAGELVCGGLGGHRSTAVFSRSRERCRSARAISMAASVINSGMISC